MKGKESFGMMEKKKEERWLVQQTSENESKR
jgi:hypothetical protein